MLCRSLFIRLSSLFCSHCIYCMSFHLQLLVSSNLLIFLLVSSNLLVIPLISSKLLVIPLVSSNIFCDTSGILKLFLKKIPDNYLSGSEYVQDLYPLFIHVFPLEAQLSRGGWDPIHLFNPATCLCLSQARTWISNIICPGLVCVHWVQLGWEVIAYFIQMGESGDHHLFNFIFIIYDLLTYLLIIA